MSTPSSMRSIGRSGAILVAGVVSVFATACGSTEPGDAGGPASTPSEGGNGTVRIVASTDVYGSIAEAVGGELVEVTSIIDDSGADPLEYESTPADAASVTEAELVVFNGNGYDEFMPALIEAAGDVESVIDVSELSGLAPAAEAAGEEFNEHVWYDLETVQTLAMRMAEELSEARPGHAAAFSANATGFRDQVGVLREQLGEISTSNQGKRIAVTEPLANYLLDDAGLENVAPEEFQEAIEEGDDPSAAVLQEMLALFGDDPVAALILNTQTQSAVTDQILLAATAAGVPIVEMSETLTAPDYVEWMGGQIDDLAGALDE